MKTYISKMCCRLFCIIFLLGIGGPVSAQLVVPEAVSPYGYVVNTESEFRWGEVAAVDSYDLQIFDSQRLLIFEQSEVVGLSHSFPIGLIEEHLGYYWRVRSRISSGEVSAWSNELGFVLYDPGFVPTSLSPRGEVYVSSAPVLKWQPVDSAQTYELEFFNYASKEVLYFVSDIAANELSLPAEVPVETGVGYGWRVRGKNAQGLVSRWSDELGFVMYNLDEVPHLLAPYGSIATTTPQLSWQGVAGAESYELQLTDFLTNEIVVDWSAIQGESFTLSPEMALRNDRGYIWRVRAKLNSGLYSAWSDPFGVVPYNSLIVPEVISPVGSVLESDLRFSWSAVEGAVRYHFVLTNFDGSEVIYESDQLQESQLDLPTDVSLQYAQGYYWKVYSVLEGEGQSRWSDLAGFIVEKDPESPIFPPVLLSPVGDMPRLQGVNFQWEVAEGAEAYNLEVRNSKGKLIYSISGLIATEHTVPRKKFKQMVPYHWRVVSVSSQTSEVAASEVVEFRLMPGKLINSYDARDFCEAQEGIPQSLSLRLKCISRR